MFVFSFLICLCGAVSMKPAGKPRTFFSNRPPMVSLADDKTQAERFATILQSFGTTAKNIGQFYADWGNGVLGGVVTDGVLHYFVVAANQADLSRRSKRVMLELKTAYDFVFKGALQGIDRMITDDRKAAGVPVDPVEHQALREQLESKNREIQDLYKAMRELTVRLESGGAALPGQGSVLPGPVTAPVVVPRTAESPKVDSKKIEINLQSCSKRTLYFDSRMQEAQGEKTPYIVSIRKVFRDGNATDIWGPLAKSKKSFWIYFDESAHQQCKLPAVESDDARALAGLIAGIWVVNSSEDGAFVAMREYMSRLNNISVRLVSRVAECGTA